MRTGGSSSKFAFPIINPQLVRTEGKTCGLQFGLPAITSGLTVITALFRIWNGKARAQNPINAWP